MLISPLTAAPPLPWVLADVLGATLRSGRVPRVVAASVIIPRGRQQTRPIRLPTGTTIEPNTTDPVLALAEERLRIAHDDIADWQRDAWRAQLKGINNALIAGLPIQVLDDEPLSKPVRQQVWTHDGRWTERLQVIERPGRWYYPPIAAGVTAAARLLLYISRHLIETHGGAVAYWDTDSLHIVATPDRSLVECPGGPDQMPSGRPAIAALSFAEVRDIQWAIESLSPYDPSLRSRHMDLTDDGYPYRVEDPQFLRREAHNGFMQTGGAFDVTTLREEINAAKRHRAYVIKVPGDHVEIHDGQPVLVPPTPAQLSELSQVQRDRAVFLPGRCRTDRSGDISDVPETCLTPPE